MTISIATIIFLTGQFALGVWAISKLDSRVGQVEIAEIAHKIDIDAGKERDHFLESSIHVLEVNNGIAGQMVKDIKESLQRIEERQQSTEIRK